jgi:NADPH:quinone reductase-like Zn-dependent oxidoreductase
MPYANVLEEIRSMQAVTHDRYGAIDTLELRDVGPPQVGTGEVLVRVRAAGLHVGDVFAVRGSPFPVRLATGLRRPRFGVPGFDLAGVVDAVGPSASRFKVGDHVFGTGTGTVAELARAKETQLVAMPAGMPFEQAAALPTSGLAALHGLRDAGRLKAGQQLLINGASGGVGTFAVQIAKAMGAHVTGVTSTPNVALLRSLGADEVVDYRTDDFTQATGRYDLIFDCIENRSLAVVRRALKPDGTLVLNSGTGATGLRMLVRLVRPILLSPFSRQTMRRYLSQPNARDLEVLRSYVEAGQVRPVIERTYPMKETVDALRHIGSGHARGKVVITMG